MRILGDEKPTDLKNYSQEPGIFFGKNDVLKGTPSTTFHYTIDFFGISKRVKTVTPQLHLHIPTSRWSSFTGKLRQYGLPWFWKTVYLDREDGTPPCRILVRRSMLGEELPTRIKQVLGQPLCVANLIESDNYKKVFGQNYLSIPKANLETTWVNHPLGKWAGTCMIVQPATFYPFHHPQGIFSIFKYQLLKQFSNSWKEVAIKTAHVTEKILIRKEDQVILSSNFSFI